MAHRWSLAALTVVALLTPGLALAESPAPGPSASAAGDPTGGAVPDVLRPLAADGSAPTQAGVAAALRAVLTDPALGKDLAISVLDAVSGQVLFTRNGSRAATPASTTKVLTAAATLAAVGPDATLRTRVVREDAPAGAATPDASSAPDQGPASGANSVPEAGPAGTSGAGAAPGPAAAPGAAATPEPPVARLVLIGGGDPLLSSLPSGTEKLPAYPRRASLDDLARQTVAALRADGIDTVRLRYDDSLFTGPDASPRWERSYTSDVIARVHALAVDQGRIGPLASSRVLDPAAAAAALFAAELRKRGLTVRGEVEERTGAPPVAGPALAERAADTTTAPEPGPAVAPGPAPATELVAEVSSAPVSALVEHTLVASDNDAAEALARHVALARGLPASFDGGARAVLAQLAELGVDTAGVRLFDGSGLSRDNLIPPQVIARTLAAAAAAPPSAVRGLSAGLAVAGVNGTLALRFATSTTAAARGLVRAKSGFLTGVVTLGGLVVDSTGRLLAFDVAADAVSPGAGLAARTALDRVAALLARCGCR